MNGTATLVVNPAALVSIAINPQSAAIALGTTQQFTATGTYTDGTTQDVTSVVTWSSSDATIAIISNAVGSYGLATSAGQGVATISATSQLDLCLHYAYRGKPGVGIDCGYADECNHSARNRHAVRRDGNIHRRQHARLDGFGDMDIVSGVGGERGRRVGDEYIAGGDHDYGYVGDDRRIGDVDGDGSGFDFDLGRSEYDVGGGRFDAAVHGNRNLQRRLDAEPEQYSDLDFVGGVGGDDRERWVGDECVAGNCNDHGYGGDDQRFDDVDGDGPDFSFDRGYSGHCVGGGWLHAAVHGDGDL